MAGEAVLRHSGRRRWARRLLLSLPLVLVLWPIQQLAEQYFLTRQAEQSRQTLDLYVANLLGTLRRFEVLPEILGEIPAIREAFARPADAAAIDRANRLLARARRDTGADTLYIMDPLGLTLAASNWDSEVSFVGRNFAFRPYFREAMAGRLGRFFGLGTTSAKRGYYFAAAVDDGGAPLGVVVVKVDLDDTETVWGSTPEQLLVTDQYGVVILTSRAEWRFRATRPLSLDERAEIAANIPYPTTEPPALAIDWSAYLRHDRVLAETGWTVSVLVPRSLIRTQVNTVLIVAASTLLALVLVVASLRQRRRHYLERIALEERAKRQLEARVVERTRDLQTLNDRLKQEILERQQAQDELLRMQDELVQAGKLSALGTMSASISHELNQPLGAIRTYADNARLLIEHQRYADASQNLGLIAQLTERMSAIIAHLRAYARRDQRAPVSVVLQQSLDEALALAAERIQALGVTVERDLPAEPLWVQAGVTRLAQVLGNLIGNALDAMADTPVRRLSVSAATAAEHTTLSIRDSGPGLDAAALARAFEPFFTTKTQAQGLGLGLAICRQIVHSLGGELELRNHPEGGAEARLRLRNATPGVVQPHAAPSALHSHRHA
ncbi:MAG TPA: ATP-binding protein [Candidatus Competibacteraceae bacterium]|nr:ATP-binding protein [Candidatus Competibacteraceae bacterium]